MQSPTCWLAQRTHLSIQKFCGCIKNLWEEETSEYRLLLPASTKGVHRAGTLSQNSSSLPHYFASLHPVLPRIANLLFTYSRANFVLRLGSRKVVSPGVSHPLEERSRSGPSSSCQHACTQGTGRLRAGLQSQGPRARGPHCSLLQS